VSSPGRLGAAGSTTDMREDGPGRAGDSKAPAGALDGPALAERIAAIASDRKAADIRLIDLRELVAYTDTLVVCSGNTERQTKAIHDAVHQQLKDEHGLLPRRVEGEREARWILMDYLDCVVHVFTPGARAFYRLEQLWGEAPARSAR
jgi:ribosome-associated protein